MTKGWVSWESKGSGILLDDLQVNVDEPPVIGASITKKSDQPMAITIEVVNVFDPAIAQEATHDVTRRLVDRVCAKVSGVVLRDPIFRGATLPKNDGSGKYTVVNDMVFAYSVADGEVSLTGVRLAELSQVLEDRPSNLDSLRSLYRLAGNQLDPLARYFLFYGILLQMCHDSQKAVDDLLLKLNPAIQTSRSPLSKPNRVFDETLFTRLRNEIAHRPGVDKRKVLQEIKQNVSELSLLTFKAIQS